EMLGRQRVAPFTHDAHQPCPLCEHGRFNGVDGELAAVGEDLDGVLHHDFAAAFGGPRVGERSTAAHRLENAHARIALQLATDPEGNGPAEHEAAALEI